MQRKACFVYNDILTRHILRDDHVMVPSRIRYTYELLDSYGAFNLPNSSLVEPRQATEQELLTYHNAEYINAVKSLSSHGTSFNPAKYNFSDHGDNPVYSGMFEASLWSTGASLTAAELIASNKSDVAFNCSGGLHHAMPDRTSGFCIFNDPVDAINYLVQLGARVAYVDIDAHHGDGVQHAYYSSDQVLTISMHESGNYLFPGTGAIEELGNGRGKGYSINIPLFPYSNDEIYFNVFDQLVPHLIDSFQPDIIATQLGMDPYFNDPITHLGLTVQGHSQLTAALGNLAPKWLAFGGGGYDISAVARGWTLDFGVMLGQDWDDNIPSSYQKLYGITNLRDPGPISAPSETLNQAYKFADMTVSEVRRQVFPAHNL